MCTGPSNILLDFLDRESRRIWGTFADFTDADHRKLLGAALNCACFLCEEYCVLPPVFIVLDDLVRRLLREKSAYLDERLVRLPLRDPTLDDWVESAQLQYRGQQGWGEKILDPNAFKFMRRHTLAIVPRQSDIGASLVDRWEQGPYVNEAWRPAKRLVAPDIIGRALWVPRRLSESGSAVTWDSIAGQLPDLGRATETALKRILQHDYFSIYADEYNLELLGNLQFARLDFGVRTVDPYYDYPNYKSLLVAAGLNHLVDNINASSMAAIRTTVGHHDLQRAHWRLTRRVSNARDIQRIYNVPLSDRDSTLWRELRVLDERRSGSHGIELDSHALEIVEERFIQLAALADRAVEDVVDQVDVGRRSPRQTMSFSNRPLRETESTQGVHLSGGSIVIFVALSEELQELRERWHLDNVFGSPAWNGRLHDHPITVICAHGAGRVQAAVEVCRYLSSSNDSVELMIVTGIAGGFAESEEVAPGDVLIAEFVADLGTRKMREGADGDLPEFRTRPYTCDNRIAVIVNSGSFNRRAWANDAARLFDYPKRQLPQIHIGTIISVDEVVSSDEWRRQLLQAWPKALGVEMEAGGVMAAAQRFGKVPVAVVRGVSDLANPLKADDEWRLRAIRAAALMIETASAIIFE